jgi:hypothetical protein
MARAGLTGGARGARAGGIERGSGRRARPNQQEQQRDGEEGGGSFRLGVPWAFG